MRDLMERNKAEDLANMRRRKKSEEKTKTMIVEKRTKEVVSEQQITSNMTKERDQKSEISQPIKEERVLVPLIKLKQFSGIELRTLELSREIPKIKVKKKSIFIPVIKLEEIPPNLKLCKLNCEIPKIKKERRLLKVPIIRVRSPLKVSMLIGKFDTKIRKPEISKNIQLRIRVPVYRKAFFPPLRMLLSSFDTRIDQQVKNCIKRIEIELEDKESVSAIEAKEPSSGGEIEFVDFLDLIFDGNGGAIKGKGPKIILFKDLENDSYINMLEAICLRIYREIEGGEPKARRISKIDEMNRIEIEKWLEAGHTIFTIDLDYHEYERRPWLEIDKDHLRDRLEETYSERIGFIIFTTRKEETFERYQELLREINEKAQNKLNIVVIRAKRLPRKLASLMWGMVNLDNIPFVIKTYQDGTPAGTTFDAVFNKAQRRFNKILEYVKNEENGLFKSATRRNKGQIEGKKRESDLHYSIKVFLVRYLTHELRKRGYSLKKRTEIMNEIKTEEGTLKPVPDIQVDSEVYEVETLFGEGENADKKIDETIDKYRGTNIRIINIVMDNFGFLLHLKDLINKRRLFRDEEYKIRFYTLNLKDMKLISLEDFIRELKSCLKGVTY